MPEPISLLVAVGADILIYALLGWGFWRHVRAGRVSPNDTPAVFKRLERVLTRLYPEANGDTMREMLERVRRSFPQFNWPNILVELEGYEAHKYGGDLAPNSSEETLKLANFLKERKP